VERGRRVVEECMGRFWQCSFDLWIEVDGPFHAAYDYLNERVHEYHHHHHDVEGDELSVGEDGEDVEGEEGV